MRIWDEFKQVVLPWVLAAGVIAFVWHMTGQLLYQYEASARLQAQHIEALSKEVEGIKDLLSQQGYVVPPTAAGRPR
jgi:hypothetical protein